MALAWLVVGCGTVDLGDNIVPPDLQLDPDYFYCEVEPKCLAMHSCAGGASGESGMCHTARSSLRLIDTAAIPSVTCEEQMPTAEIPAEFTRNLEAIQFTVQSDPDSSPLYRRPTGMDSHPRVVFDTSDPCAEAIRSWIVQGGL